MTLSTMTLTKTLAALGLCALAGLGSAAFAQGDYGHDGGAYHGPAHHARQAILRQKADYARAVANGHYGAAERAHLRAKAIRQHVRARRVGEQGYAAGYHDGDHRDGDHPNY